MFIQSITIEGYRSIEAVSINPGEITVLLGRNNSGKSNIINAIDDFKYFAGIGYRPSESDIRDIQMGKNRTADIVYDVKFGLTKAERYDILSGVVDPPATVQNMIQEGWFEYIKYKSGVISGERTISRVTTSNGDNEEIHLIDGPNSNLLRLNRLPEIIWQNAGTPPELYNNGNPSMRTVMSESFKRCRTLDAFRSFEPRQTVDLEEVVNSDGSNLVRVFDSIYRNHPDKFEKIRESYISIMEGVTELRTELQEGGYTTTYVKEEAFDESFTLDDISSGSKQILTLITKIVMAPENSDILLLEEPELHLHPAAQQEIWDLIEDVAQPEGPQIFISTHSKTFVDRANIGDITLVSRKEGKTRTHSVGEADLGYHLLDMGFDKSGILQSRGVIFVEGLSDRRVLRNLSETLDFDLEHYGIEIIELEGIDNVKQNVKALAKLLTSFEIPFLFVIDRHDDPVEKVRGELFESARREEGQWWDISRDDIFVWDAYGIEEYLLSPAAISRILDGPSEQDIVEIIESADRGGDREPLLDEIFRKALPEVREGEPAFNKHIDGPRIAREMKPEDVDEEVYELLEEISKRMGIEGEIEMNEDQ